jgi:hypothetical protein
VATARHASQLTRCSIQNKSLSDDSDEILQLQGVGWFMRQAIAFATITLYVKQYKDEGGIEHIDIRQVLTGGIEGTEENRALNWTERSHKDRIFGDVSEYYSVWSRRRASR